MIVSAVLKNWRLIAVGMCAAAIMSSTLYGVHLIWKTAYRAGFQAADLDCASAALKAATARDEQVAQIRAEEKRKRDALAKTLADERAAARLLSDQLAVAKTNARNVRERAAHEIETALRNTGSAQCTLTGRVSDVYREQMSAFTDRHTDGN